MASVAVVVLELVPALSVPMASDVALRCPQSVARPALLELVAVALAMSVALSALQASSVAMVT
jgi:hypothetical protein